MTPENFCYWLQGRLELNSTHLTSAETDIIREHLQLVFKNLTPTYTVSNVSGVYPKGYLSDGTNTAC